MTYTADSVVLTVVEPDVTCESDVADDGIVDFTDLIAVISAWGPCGEQCPEDINEDGFVGVEDLIAVISAWGPCPENLAYDVTFSSPLHTVGQPPTTGGGAPTRERVTYIWPSTSVTVVDASGALLDQPLELDWSVPNQRIATCRFELRDLPAPERHRVELDVSASELGEFGRSALQIRLAGNNTITAEFRDSGLRLRAGGENIVTVPFTLATLVALRFEVDTEAGRAEIFVDDALVISGSIATDEPIANLQVFGGRLGTSTGRAAIDDVRITAIE